jgi:hypothetical protein
MGDLGLAMVGARGTPGAGRRRRRRRSRDRRRSHRSRSRRRLGGARGVRGLTSGPVGRPQARARPVLLRAQLLLAAAVRGSSVRRGRGFFVCVSCGARETCGGEEVREKKNNINMEM